jgi:transcriptional regulator with XRE-family HTH domain
VVALAVLPSAAVRAAELGEFLRSRRARVDPATSGFPTGRRRTPGLRREELASIAGVTVSWLAKLEQGRARSVSPAVLDALSRGLALDAVERSHLFALAGLRPDPVERADDRPVTVTPALQALVDALEPNPAYLLDRSWNLVAWNGAEEALFPALAEGASRRSAGEGSAGVGNGGVGPGELARPNLLVLTFTDPALARLMLDHDAELQRLVSQFRLHCSDWPDDPDLAALVATLTTRSPRFAELWSAKDVAPFETTRREFDHPVAGRLAFDHHRLVVLGEPGLQLVAYTPADGSDSAVRLRDAARPTS